MTTPSIEEAAHREALRHLLFELEVKERRIRLQDVEIKALREQLEKAYGELARMARASS